MSTQPELSGLLARAAERLRLAIHHQQSELRRLEDELHEAAMLLLAEQARGGSIIVSSFADE